MTQSNTVIEDDFAGDINTIGVFEVGGTATGTIDFVGDSDFFAIEIEAGDVVRIRSDDFGAETALTFFDEAGNIAGFSEIDSPFSNSGSLLVKIEESGTFFVGVEGIISSAPLDYTVTAIAIEDDFAGDISTTGVLELGGFSNGTTGRINYLGDIDFFAIELDSEDFVLISSDDFFFATRLGLYDEAGNLVRLADFNPDDGFRTLFVEVEESGTYFVGIEGLRDVGGNGTYTVFADARSVNISGTPDDDTIRGFSLDDTLNGGQGDDIINGGTGNDIIIGGLRGDAFIVSGEITELSDGSGSTVPRINFTVETEGVVTIDVLNYGFDLDEDGVLGGLISDISVFTADPTGEGGLGIPLAGNLVTGGLTDGSVTEGPFSNTVFDGFLELDLEPGDYVLTIGSSFTSEDEARSGINDSSPRGDADFQITFSGVSSVEGDVTFELLESDNDTLIGGAGDDLINGGIGADVLDGGTDNDRLFGGEGDDLLIGGIGADVLNGGAGTDTADYSTAGAGVIASLISPSANRGDALGDTYFSIENIIGSAFNDRLFGDIGINTLIGGDGDDLLNGGDGDDIISDGAGDDISVGGAGNDVFIAGTGANDFRGNAGIDTVDFSQIDGRAFVNLATQTINDAGQPDGEANDDVIASIENLIGTNSGDFFLGNNGQNRLEGGAGNDTLNGGAGNDIIVDGDGDDLSIGGAGNDLFIAGAGANTYRGNAGIDTVDFSGFGEGIGINLQTQTVFGTGEISDDIIASIDSAIGSAQSDTLIGNTGFNTLDGGAGDDIIIGAGGVDLLFGGAGADTFVLGAGFGRDRLFDFENGVDIFQIESSVAMDFSDLTIQQAGQDVIFYATASGRADVLRIVEADVADIDASDFIFSPASAAPASKPNSPFESAASQAGSEATEFVDFDLQAGAEQSVTPNQDPIETELLFEEDVLPAQHVGEAEFSLI